MKKTCTRSHVVVCPVPFKQFIFLLVSWLLLTPGFSANAIGKVSLVNPNAVSAIMAGETIASFTLMNADTDTDIQVISNGSTINLDALPTKNLNIRINTNPTTVGSVVMSLTGKQSKNSTETGAPYALFGDVGGNYHPWIPVAGGYTLKATPYSGSGGGGSAGTSKTITFTFTNGQKAVQVNFQDPNTVPPSGWARDYGQPYGLRTGAYQGSNLTYGWKRRIDGSLLNLAVGGTTPGNGRNRSMPSDPLLATLLHMQADDIAGNFDGFKAEGYWETKVGNGIYDVTVSAGDAGVYSFPEKHTINVEGAQAIKDFIPAGAAGALTRFKTATVRVTVSDGNLTIDADGGINTKINSVKIVPFSTGAYTYWSANELQITTEKGSSSANKTFSLDISNSSNRNDLQYTVTAVYGSGVSPWLSFNATHTGAEPNVTFNYAAAQNLPVGTYKATINAIASGFTTGSVTIIVKVSAPRPYVISSTPANGATNVNVNTSSIAANNIFVPEVAGYQGGVDNSTITSSTVKLLKVVGSSTTQIQGVVQGTGGGDAISFSPTFALEPNSTYRFVITEGVKSHSLAPFIPYTATFTTGAAIEPADPIAVEFTKVPIVSTQNKKYASLTIGPDGKLYALLLNGNLERYAISRPDGALTFQANIPTLPNKYGGRSAIGLVFDPASTASNLIAYISHCSSGLTGALEFDGKISKLTGANLSTEQLLVTNLPRSAKDHLVNSMVFGSDGALYISQGSNSSMGAYDGSWQRTESLLSGAILKLNLAKLGSGTLDARTTNNQSVINAASTSSITMSDGSYNPYATNSPLTIHASGVRNAYDLVRHSNGQLYAPANGSAAGGNTPASVAGTRRINGTTYTGPAIPATSAVQVQNDWLFRIKPGGYYGHPNPLRGEYVANRGFTDNPKYPNTVVADANYRGAAYNFELNRSPNGAIEYKSNAFNGALKGKLLVCRFSGGGDIIVLEPKSVTPGSPDADYDIKIAYTGAGTTGLVGMSGFINPLDVVEDTQTGNLYVIEYNWNNIPDRKAQITLLRVSPISDDEGFATAFPEKISATEVVGVTNTGTAAVTQKLAAITKIGENKKDKDKDKDSDTDLPDFSRVTKHAVTISNTGRGNLKLKGLDIVGENAGEFQLFGQPDAKPNKPVKIRKNSSVTFNVAFFPTSKGLKRAKLEAVSSKKKQDQSVSVELVGLGITYEGIDSTGIGAILDSVNTVTSKLTHKVNAKEPKLSVYPNPNQVGSKIYIDLADFGARESITLSLYDTFGQLYQAKTVRVDEQGVSSAELPVSKNMNPGIYIIKATSASGQKQVKVVLE